MPRHSSARAGPTPRPRGVHRSRTCPTLSSSVSCTSSLSVTSGLLLVFVFKPPHQIMFFLLVLLSLVGYYRSTTVKQTCKFMRLFIKTSDVLWHDVSVRLFGAIPVQTCLHDISLFFPSIVSYYRSVTSSFTNNNPLSVRSSFVCHSYRGEC